MWLDQIRCMREEIESLREWSISLDENCLVRMEGTAARVSARFRRLRGVDDGELPHDVSHLIYLGFMAGCSLVKKGLGIEMDKAEVRDLALEGARLAESIVGEGIELDRLSREFYKSLDGEGGDDSPFRERVI